MPCPIAKGRVSTQDLIVTPKSSSAIPVSNTLRRDLVIQTALDPAVVGIEYIRTVPVGAANYLFDGIVVVRDGTRHAVEFQHASVVRTLDLEGLRLLAIEKIEATPFAWTPTEVLREPRCTNARLIWECSHHRVRLDRRLGILDSLDCWGAMPLRNFDAPRADVFALACEAAVDVDLEAKDLDSALIRRSSRMPIPRPRITGV